MTNAATSSTFIGVLINLGWNYVPQVLLENTHTHTHTHTHTRFSLNGDSLQVTIVSFPPQHREEDLMKANFHAFIRVISK